MTKKFLLAIIILSGLSIATGVFAATSPKGCETDTMKNGELCSWVDGGKSWCGGNTYTCAIEPTSSCPANPLNGTYAFGCNTCSCALTCDSGYTNCSGTCTSNCTAGSNCATCDTCTSNVCTSCNAGYDLVGSTCVSAPLKISNLSNVAGFIKQVTTPSLTLDGSGNLAPSGDLQLLNNKSIALTGVGTTSLWFGNYNGATPFAYGTGDVVSLGIEGDLKANRLCFQDDCRSDWASVGGGSSMWTRTGSNIFPTTLGDNVGIGITNPLYNLQVMGAGANYNDGNIAVNPAGQAYPGIFGRFQRNNDVSNGANFYSYLANDMIHTNVGAENSYYVYNQYVDGQSLSMNAEGFKFWYADANTNGQTVIASELMRLSSTGNIGLGTSQPIAPLHILKATSTPLRFLILDPDSATNGAGSIIHFVSSTDANVGSQIAGIREGSGGTSYLSFTNYLNGTGFVERLRITGAGNVGINTTAPNDTFSIGNSGSAPAGSSNTGHNFTSTYLSTDDYALTNYGIVKTLIGNATSSLPSGANFWGGTLNGNIWNGDAGVGNVGIGTTTPTSLLTINSTTAGDGGTNNGNGSILYVKQNATWTGNQQWALYVDGYTYLNGFRINGRDTTRSLFQTISTFPLGFATSGDQPITFTQSSNVERMRIAAGGNVGIGTSTPAYKLTVVGTSYLNGQISTSLSGAGNRCLYVDATGNVSAKTADCGTATGGDNLGDHTATQNILLGNYWLSGDGGNEGLFVNSVGNVGVGTSLPTNKLTLKGDLSVEGTATTSNAVLNFSTPYYGRLNYSVTPVNGKSEVRFVSKGALAGNGQTYFVIASTEAADTGNNLLLGVAGGRAFIANASNYSAAGTLHLGGTSWGANGVVQISGLPTDATGLMSVMGNVGIGTTAPTTKLFVSAAGAPASSGDMNTGIVVGSYGSVGLNMGANYSVTPQYSWIKSAFTDSASSLLPLSLQPTGGNVGVGTIAPNDTFSIGNSGTAPAGSSATGHNYTNTYLSSDDYALTNYGIVKTLIAAATSSLPAGGTNFWGGTLNGTIWNGASGAGNVGIGTTTPYAPSYNPKLFVKTTDNSSLLELYGSGLTSSSAFSIYLPLSTGLGDGRAFQFVVPGETYGRGVFYSDGSYGIGSGSGTRDVFISRQAANSLMISSDRTTTGAAKLFVTGNIGIGTTTPAHKLTVVGTSYLNGQITTSLSGAGNRCLYVDATGNVSAKTADCGTATGGDNLGDHIATQNIRLGNYWLSSDGDNEGVFVNSTGNVGIGTSNPTNTTGSGRVIHVLDSVGYTQVLAENTAATGGAFFAQKNDTGKQLSYVTFGSTNPNSALFGVTRPNNSFMYTYTGGALTIGTLGPNNLTFGTNSAANMTILSGGNVGIGTAAPNDVFSIGNSGTAPAGSSNTGHNYTSTYLSTDNYALANYGIVKTLIAAATSSMPTGTGTSTIGKYVGVTASAYVGDNGVLGKGYDAANAICASTVTDSHVCATYEILNTIATGSTMPTEPIVWILNGPPGYTTEANDCDGRSKNTTTSYGAVWQTNTANWVNGRGMLTACNNSNKFACCK